MKIPQKYLDEIGSEQIFSGQLFGKKEIPETRFKILDVRFGRGFVVDMVKFKAGLPYSKHPTVEYLIKNNSMTRSRWTKGFACREIDLNKLSKNKGQSNDQS
jgi:hypothetical protein